MSFVQLKKIALGVFVSLPLDFFMFSYNFVVIFFSLSKTEGFLFCFISYFIFRKLIDLTSSLGVSLCQAKQIDRSGFLKVKSRCLCSLC